MAPVTYRSQMGGLDQLDSGRAEKAATLLQMGHLVAKSAVGQHFWPHVAHFATCTEPRARTTKAQETFFLASISPIRSSSWCMSPVSCETRRSPSSPSWANVEMGGRTSPTG